MEDKTVEDEYKVSPLETMEYGMYTKCIQDVYRGVYKMYTGCIQKRIQDVYRLSTQYSIG